MKKKTISNYIKGEHFSIIGSIQSWMLADLIKFLSKRKNKKVNVIVHSNGGDANVAKSIYDILQQHDTTTIALNSVQSAGFTIFMGGKKRVASEDTIFMVHNAKSDSFIENHFSRNGFLARTQKQMIEILNSEKIKLPRGDRKKYLSSEELLKQGVVTEIL